MSQAIIFLLTLVNISLKNSRPYLLQKWKSSLQLQPVAKSCKIKCNSIYRHKTDKINKVMVCKQYSTSYHSKIVTLLHIFKEF